MVSSTDLHSVPCFAIDLVAIVHRTMHHLKQFWKEFCLPSRLVAVSLHLEPSVTSGNRMPLSWMQVPMSSGCLLQVKQPRNMQKSDDLGCEFGSIQSTMLVGHVMAHDSEMHGRPFKKTSLLPSTGPNSTVRKAQTIATNPGDNHGSGASYSHSVFSNNLVPVQVSSYKFVQSTG